MTSEGRGCTCGCSPAWGREVEQRFAVRVLESMRLAESRCRVGVTVRSAEEWNVYDPQIIR